MRSGSKIALYCTATSGRETPRKRLRPWTPGRSLAPQTSLRGLSASDAWSHRNISMKLYKYTHVGAQIKYLLPST